MANSNEENDESHQIWETDDSEGIPLFWEIPTTKLPCHGRNMIAFFRAGAGHFMEWIPCRCRVSQPTHRCVVTGENLGGFEGEVAEVVCFWTCWFFMDFPWSRGHSSWDFICCLVVLFQCLDLNRRPLSERTRAIKNWLDLESASKELSKNCEGIFELPIFRRWPSPKKMPRPGVLRRLPPACVVPKLGQRKPENRGAIAEFPLNLVSLCSFLLIQGKILKLAAWLWSFLPRWQKTSERCGVWSVSVSQRAGDVTYCNDPIYCIFFGIRALFLVDAFTDWRQRFVLIASE